MSHIFISYSRKDIDFASKIVQALAENNLDTWIDWKSIPKGEDWEQEIYRGVEEADAFLFLISLDSASSKMCNKEIAHAVKNGKRILPIYISNINVDEVNKAFLEDKSREEISRRNYIFCRDRLDDFDKAIEEIRNTIHTDFEWLTYQRELQVKALKWEQKKDASRLLRGKELREGEQQLTEINNKADPQPTKLQREYVLASRRNEEQQRRQIIIGMSLGLIILTILSIFAWTQRNEAKLQEAIAQSASTKAIEQEQIAKTNEAEAKRQEETALARQLAAQSELLISQEPKKLSLAVLLSLESLKLADTSEGSSALRNGLALLPDLVAKFQILQASRIGTSNVIKNPVKVIKFSPDGRWLGVGTEGEIISVWDVSTWKEILHVQPATYGGVIPVVRSLSFSPDGNFLVTGADGGYAQVWDIASGEEISHFFHSSQVWVVDFTPDGKRVISGGGEEVIIWDPQTGTEFYRLKAGTNILAISPNGKVAASAAKTSITVWDVDTGKILTTKNQIIPLDNDDDLLSIDALIFSPDGSMIASSEGNRYGPTKIPPPDSIGGRIIIWDTLTGNDIANLMHGDEVSALAFSSDGKKLVSGSFDNTSRVWNVSTGESLSNFNFNNSISSVAFGKKDEWIVSSSYDGTARIWDSRTGEEINRLITENDTKIESIAIAPNGEFVAGGNSEGVWVWQIQGQEITKLEHGQALTISYVDFSTDGKMLVTASWDRKARTWDAKTSALMATVVHEKQVFLSVFNPKNDKYVASADLGGQVKVWDPITGIESFQIPKFKEISQVLFSPNGSLLAISEGLFSRDGWQSEAFKVDSEEGVVSIWDIAKGIEIARLRHDAIVNSIAFSPDSKQILSASKDGVARLWDIETKTIISKVEFNQFLNIVALSPNGHLAAGVESCLRLSFPGFNSSCSSKPKLRVWKPETGEVLWDKTLEGSWVSNLSFSPDSKLLVIENNFSDRCSQKDCKNNVIVWNALSGKVVNQKNYELEFGLMVLAFNKEGTLIATGGGPAQNGWVDIWEPLSGKQISRIPYQQAISAVFSPSEETIAIVGNQDGIAYAKIFSLGPKNLENVACSRLRRNFTEQEWQDYLGNIPYEDICSDLTQKSNDPNGSSYGSQISRDGRWITFISEASNFVCGNTNISSDIFLYSREKETIQKISNPVYGQVSMGIFSSPYISNNGNYIVYTSSADNLIANDLNKKRDIFLYDRVTGQTELVSVNSKNEQANDDSFDAFVSDDGRFVIFKSRATNLVPGDNNEDYDFFIRDRKTSETHLISTAENIAYRNEPDSFSVDIRTIDGDRSLGEYELEEVFLDDFKNNTSKLISTSSNGVRGNGDSASPAISEDGRFIVFASESSNLVEGDNNIAWDVFLWDHQTGKIQRIIMAKDGSQPNGHSLATDISGDGRYVSFTSTASNLVDGDFNAMRDVFVYDTQNNTTKRIEPIACSQEK